MYEILLKRGRRRIIVGIANERNVINASERKLNLIIINEIASQYTVDSAKELKNIMNGSLRSKISMTLPKLRLRSKNNEIPGYM